MRAIALSAAAAVVALGLGSTAAAEAAPPTAATGKATSVSLQGATLNATVNPNGERTTFFFAYGTSTSYGSTTPVQEAGSGSGPIPVSAPVAGLPFGTGFHYRVVAANASGQANGEDGGFRTLDAVLSGRYAVTLRIVSGGRPFGQRKGQALHRRYRLTAECAAGSCPTLRLHRPGARGVFASRLTRGEGDRYSGVERSSGRCNNAERFRARASLLLYPTSLRGARAATIAGRLIVRVRGCARGREVATLRGSLIGHG
jgi:hypothetical protein